MLDVVGTLAETEVDDIVVSTAMLDDGVVQVARQPNAFEGRRESKWSGANASRRASRSRFALGIESPAGIDDVEAVIDSRAR